MQRKTKEKTTRPKPEGARCSGVQGGRAVTLKRPGFYGPHHRQIWSPIEGKWTPTGNRKPGKQGKRRGHSRPSAFLKRDPPHSHSGPGWNSVCSHAHGQRKHPFIKVKGINTAAGFKRVFPPSARHKNFSTFSQPWLHISTW